ncbi:MAG TPA: hypothetical protein DCK98_17510 [Chloroflexi bacterium]|jgi:class 3 adenylate cyclase|nr:hypothetical protein [Chloroflexota bacterium]HAL25998.1 hypothetical protein [Chloroflexota bacterium]
MHERHQERRLVTCLFIDVVGSTELTMRLGPERLKNALDAAFSELRALIVAHGGTVEKYIGDAIYALFGAPVSHADDPCRALRVAFTCLRWAAERDPADVPFSVRVGVETGEAIVDLSAAETTMQQMSVGAVVNIAARLQQRAEPGQALVGPTCHAAAFDAAELIPLGEIELKGIGTLPAWSLVGIADVAPSVSLPFVGRDAELSLLGYALQRAVSGRSVLALVSGPPGQGKTRLVSEFVSHLTPETRLITARCRPEGEIGALTPLRQLLGDHLEELLGELFDDRAERARVAAVLTHSAGLLTSEALTALVPTERADEIANGWRRYLAALARGGSLVAWIEDVHWADPAVVRLIDRVTKGSDRLLVVATARPEFSEAAGLRPSGDRFFIELAGLEADAASSLAQSAGRTDDLALARADGNPLFIVELARARGASADDALPLTLHGALGARLDELAPADRSLLAHAAVAGETFSVEDAASLVEFDPSAVGRVLARLADLQYVDQVRGGYRFHHSLVRDVAYGRLLMAERMRLHARYARERVNPEDAEVLAHHWWAALRPPDADWVWQGAPDLADMRREAFAAHLAAGRAHAQHFATSRAVELLERAVALAADRRGVGDAERALGDAYAIDFNADDAWAHYLRAREAYGTDGRVPSELYRGMLDIRTKGGAFRAPPDETFVDQLLAEAESAARASGDKSDLARVLLHRGLVPGAWDDLDLLREADRMAAESGDRAVRIETLGWLVGALLDRCDLDAANPLLAELERLRATTTGATSLEPLEPIVRLSIVALLRGDLAEAQGHAERAVALSAPMGPHLRTHAAMHVSLVALARGDWDLVRALGRETQGIIAASPATPFCLFAAVTLTNGAIGEALEQRDDDARALLRVTSGISSSREDIEMLGALPRAMLGEPLELPDRALVWWYLRVSRALALSVTRQWPELEDERSRLRALGANGARALVALADALDETLAATSGGPVPSHASLRALGFFGWSQLLVAGRADRTMSASTG